MHANNTNVVMKKDKNIRFLWSEKKKYVAICKRNVIIKYRYNIMYMQQVWRRCCVLEASGINVEVPFLFDNFQIP